MEEEEVVKEEVYEEEDLVKSKPTIRDSGFDLKKEELEKKVTQRQ